jgi:hypothetical protein
VAHLDHIHSLSMNKSRCTLDKSIPAFLPYLVSPPAPDYYFFHCSLCPNGPRGAFKKVLKWKKLVQKYSSPDQRIG